MLPKDEQETLASPGIKKDQAEQLFFQTDLNQNEIAKQVGVSDRTLSRWVKDNQWKQLKAAARYMPAQIVDNFQAQLAKLQHTIMSREDSLPTLDEVNIMSRLVLCIARMKVQVTKISNIEVLQNFIGFVGALNKDLANENTRLANQFLNGKAQHGLFPYEIGYNYEPDENSQLEPGEGSPEESCHPELRGTKQEGSTELINTSPLEADGTGHDRTTPPLEINNLSPQPDNNSARSTPKSPFKPAIKYDGHWLDWKGNGMVHDYETSTIRKMTTDEWNAFLKIGYTPLDLDNYQYIPDPVYDEERRKIIAENKEAYARHREKIENVLAEMKRDYYRKYTPRENRW